jgi:hypothetical protein
VLCTMLMLAAFLLMTPRNFRPIPYLRFALGWLVFIMALSTKETAIALPLILLYYFLMEVQRGRNRIKIAALYVFPAFLIVGGYAAGRILLLHGIGGYHSGEGHFRIGSVLWKNFGDFLCGLTIGSGIKPFDVWMEWLAIMVLLAVLVSLRHRTPVFGAFWMIGMLALPVMMKRAIVLRMTYTRFLYAAIPGFLLVLLWLIKTVADRRIPAVIGFRILPALAGMIMVLYIMRSWSAAGLLRDTVAARDADITQQIYRLHPDLPENATIYVIKSNPIRRKAAQPASAAFPDASPDRTISKVVRYPDIYFETVYPGKNIKYQETDLDGKIPDGLMGPVFVFRLEMGEVRESRLWSIDK